MTNPKTLCRRSLRRVATAALALLILPMWSVIQEPGVPAAEAMAAVGSAPDTDGALAAARRQNTDVVVDALTTETRLVRAKPNGKLEAELTVQPVRVRAGKGWSAPDSTLILRPDRTVAPRAAAAEMVFSGGGDGPLVRFGAAGAWMELRWPGKLPVPVLSGSTATYAEVLPGVDLVMTARTGGYSQQLMVKTAKAVRGEGLSRIVQGLRTSGLTLKAGKDGGLRATNAAGAEVFTAPPSTMWDSAPTPKVGKVGLRLGRNQLVLTPDRKLLRNPAAVLPIVIDPSPELGRHSWAQVYSGTYPTAPIRNQAYWNKTASTVETDVQVGQCYDRNGGCNGIGTARGYFQFDTRFLHDKVYGSATFGITAHYGSSCASKPHRLYAAWGNVGESTTWNSQPGISYVDEAGVGPVGRGPGCPGDMSAQAISFQVANFISTTGVSTYLLAAKEEGDDLAWRKYNISTVFLRVTYNTKPNPPKDFSIIPARSACNFCGGLPYYGDDIVKVSARLSDPDGDLVTPKWTVAGQASTGTAGASGALFNTDVALHTRQDGVRVDWKVYALDSGGVAGDEVGGYSFVVDRTPVDKLPTVTGDLYLEDNRWHGGAGIPGRFTFGANGIADIDHYRYGWDDGATTIAHPAALGGPVTVSLAPVGDGPRDLYVRSVDRAGRQSPVRVFHIYVRAGSGSLAQWSLDGDATDTAFLGDRDGQLHGAAAFGEGAVGLGASLPGASPDHLSAPNAINTGVSFSVSAWARVTRTGQAQAVVSQDGTVYPGFALWYRPENGGRWAFGMTDADATATTTDIAWDNGPAVVGEWTHLVGVFDASSKQVKLYVNGRLTGTVARPHNPWSSTGRVRIGSTLWFGGLTDWFAGGIDEVKLHDRMLSETEIRLMVSQDNVQVGHWMFEEPGGNTAVNSRLGGSSLVLSAGGTFARPGIETGLGGALKLNGTNGFAGADAQLRTDRDFTVAAWVKPDRQVVDGKAFTVVSQDGVNRSAFLLQCRPVAGSADTVRWTMMAPTADVTSGEIVESVDASITSRVGEAVHVAGVYDATAKRMYLYVNGQRAGEATRNGGFHAAGGFNVGRGLWGGYTDHFSGQLDDIRAYSRVLSDAELQAIVARSNVTAGQWRLDGTAADSSARKLKTDLVGNPEFAAGQTSAPDPGDLALKLNGTSQYAVADHALDTAASFSVAAWARLDAIGGYPAVVSQDGSHNSAFQLQATPGGNWAITTFSADAAGGGASPYRLLGPSVQIGVWTHLAAVFDKGSRKLHLYVNGGHFASLDAGPGWNYQPGQLVIGAAKWLGARTDYFPGAVDDVAVYSRILFADEIRTMAGRDLSLVHQWTLDEPSGRYAGDSVGSRTATAVGGPSHVAGRSGNALQFDGVDDAITTAGVDLRTDKSFSVSAWVNLRRIECPDPQATCRRDAVTVDGPSGSKFSLGHIVDSGDAQGGAWVFDMPELDSGNALAAVHVWPEEDFDRWVHLAGVYDAAGRTLWLYVNGTRQGSGTLNTPWQSTGGLAIGRGKAAGAPARHWPGSVDDVRLYTGNLDHTRVQALYASYPSADSPVTMPSDPKGYWKLDEGSGTVAADSSGGGRTATLSGTAGWIGGRHGNAVKLDGTSAHAQTSGPVLDTAQSFTVTAWAYTNALNGPDRTVLGQDGNRASAFQLQYQSASRRWAAVIPSADVDNPQTTVLTAAEPTISDSWTHLALSYDKPTGQLRLYVNGLLSAVRTGVVTWNGTGPMTMGRAKRNGVAAEFFTYTMDEVRAYQRALGSGEVKALHDSVWLATMGAHRFDDGTPVDLTWRKMPVTAYGGPGYGAGVSGKALYTDGVNDHLVTGSRGILMEDSFAVAAWVKLTSKSKVATVVAQDGTRMSGFVLQYRPAMDRWVFGAPKQDADGAEFVYAVAPDAAVSGQWVHLAGVYDHPGRQMQLYVNGELVAVESHALWRANGGLTIGRGRHNGLSADFFPGAIDEVYHYAGLATEAQIAQLSTHPAPSAGYLGRWTDASGRRHTASTGQPVPAGYRFDGSLGSLVGDEHPGTTILYSCQAGTDTFSSIDSTCEGAFNAGQIGRIYPVKPSNVVTSALYRCISGTERFDSVRADCEGSTVDRLLGHTLGYSMLTRYFGGQGEHWSDVGIGPLGYRTEGPQGFLAISPQSGTVPLLSCLDGYDQYLTTDATCGGKTVLGTVGHVRTTASVDSSTRELWLCKYGESRFITFNNCGSHTAVSSLGHVFVGPPNPTPIFG